MDKKAKQAISFESMSDEVLEETVRSYSLMMAEALQEQRKRRDELVDQARKEYEEATEKLINLGQFSRLSLNLPNVKFFTGNNPFFH